MSNITSGMKDNIGNKPVPDIYFTKLLPFPYNIE
jgi:hypothetical protein